jgi:hypothetical protein
MILETIREAQASGEVITREDALKIAKQVLNTPLTSEE